MSTAPVHAIAVRFADKAWSVEAPGVFLGPYMSRQIAVQVAALHAKSVARNGGSVSIRVHDEVGRLVGCWGCPAPESAGQGFERAPGA